jgi:hypothetical protein
MTSSPPLPSDILDPPPRFSLLSLLIVQALCAVFFAAMAAWGIFSVPIAVAAALFLASMHVRPDQRPLKRFAVDLLGGIFLPVLLAYYDPFFFGPNRGSHWQVLVYALLGFQITALIVWLFGQWRLVPLSGLFAGIFLAGAIMAFGCGIMFLPLSLFGLFVVLGLGGFAPFITSYVLLRNYLQAKKLAYSQGRDILATLAILLGLFLAFAVPCLIYFVWGEYLFKIVERIPWPPDVHKYLDSI